MEQQKSLLVFGLVLSLGMVASSGIAAGTFYKVRALDNTLQVTGSAKQRVTSDTVKWNSSFSRTVTIDGLKDGYKQMASDSKAVKAFLLANGLTEDQLDISTVTMSENYVYDPSGSRPKEYTLRQTVQINSSDVMGLTALAKKTDSLINSGVIFSTDSLEYYVSNLPDLRVSLLGEAVKDAQARAEAIAQSGGHHAGDLKSASVGSVQVLQVNSTDVSDYGSYDTSKIEKEVMVTVRGTFNIK